MEFKKSTTIIGDWALIVSLLVTGLLIAVMVAGLIVGIKIILLIIASLIVSGILMVVLVHPARGVSLLIIWIFIQDLLVMSLSQVISGQDFYYLGQLVFLVKEGLLVAGIIAAVRFRIVKGMLVLKKFKGADWFAIALSAWVILYLFIPNTVLGGPSISFITKLTAARMILILMLLYVFGRWVPFQDGDLSRTLWLFFCVGLVSLLLGVMMTLMPTQTWLTIGLRDYYGVKLGTDIADSILAFGLPRNFYFPDLPPSLVPWPGLRRLSTTIVAPNTVALVFSGLFLIAASRSRKGLSRGELFFGLGTLLAMGRGGLFVAVIGYLLIKFTRPWLILSFGLLGGLGILYLYREALTGPMWNAGTGLRFSGLVDGLLYTIRNPLGKGLGTSSYLALARAGEGFEVGNVPSFSAEMFFNTIGIQIGLVGYILFIGFMLSTVRQLFYIWRNWYIRDIVFAKTSLGLSGIMMGLFLLSFFSATGYGFVGVGLMFMFSGIVINRDEIKEFLRS